MASIEKVTINFGSFACVTANPIWSRGNNDILCFCRNWITSDWIMVLIYRKRRWKVQNRSSWREIRNKGFGNQSKGVHLLLLCRCSIKVQKQTSPISINNYDQSQLNAILLRLPWRWGRSRKKMLEKVEILNMHNRIIAGKMLFPGFFQTCLRNTFSRRTCWWPLLRIHLQQGIFRGDYKIVDFGKD